MVVLATDPAGNTAQRQFTVSVAPAAAAPVLTPASPSLGGTNKSTPATISLTGSFINNGTGTTTITVSNANAVAGGIALTGVTGEGTWQYSTNGTTFQNVTPVSSASALLLAKSAQLRYIPNGQDSEIPTITYRAWDTTSGSNGGRVDLSASTAVGGTTAFSTSTDTASLTVNDAPVLTAASPSFGNTLPSVAKTITLATFINFGTGTTTITDADANAVVGGVAVTGTTGKGTWAYSLNGTAFVGVGTVANNSALLLPKAAILRYTPDGTDAETATITYRAWDTTTGQPGTDVDTTSNGSDTAFSAATDTASLVVNTAPILTPASPPLGTTHANAPVTIHLTTFINQGTGTTTISDPDPGAAIGGIAVTAVTGKGTWAYSLDGTTFYALGQTPGSSTQVLTIRARQRPTAAQYDRIALYAGWYGCRNGDDHLPGMGHHQWAERGFGRYHGQRWFDGLQRPDRHRFAERPEYSG